MAKSLTKICPQGHTAAANAPICLNPECGHDFIKAKADADLRQRRIIAAIVIPVVLVAMIVWLYATGFLNLIQKVQAESPLNKASQQSTPRRR